MIVVLYRGKVDDVMKRNLRIIKLRTIGDEKSAWNQIFAQYIYYIS